jgi:hypothetical protein
MAPDRAPLTSARADRLAGERADEREDDEEGGGGDGGGGGGGSKLDVPKPILIVVIIVIALGVVSCAVGGLRGATEGPPALGDNPFDFENLLDPQPIRAAELGLAGVNGGSCQRAGAVIQVAGTCQVLVEGRILPPRELRVRIDSGTANVVVRQEVRGEVETSDPESFTPGETFDVSGGGTNDVEVFVACGGAGCDLRVLQ